MSAATTSAAGRLTDAELKAQEKAARKADSRPMTAPGTTKIQVKKGFWAIWDSSLNFP